MASISKKIASGRALGADYHVHDRTGTIEGTETRAETEVTGSVSGGGGFSSGGTGFNNPVSGNIQSKTTHFQNIYLKDEDGDEHTIDLVNFLVPCKEGHKLTFFIAKCGNNQVGPYFQAYNHNTREHYESGKALRSEMFPARWFIIGLGVVALVMFLMSLGSTETLIGAIALTLFTTLILGGVLWVVGAIIGSLRARSVRNNPQFKAHVAALARR